MRSKFLVGVTAALSMAAIAGPVQAQVVSPAPTTSGTPGTTSGVPSIPNTPTGPLIHIRNCTVSHSRNAGGFAWASCSIVATNLTSADSPAVSYRSNLKPFNPGTLGPWSRQTGRIALGSVSSIKFAYKGKSVSQVRKALKVTISKPADGTITAGTAVAAPAKS